MTKTVLFPQLRVGSRTRVKWSFTETGRSVLGFNYTWRPSFTLPVGEARIRFACADDVPLRVDARGPFEFTRSTADGQRVVEATLRDYAGQVPEKAMVAPRDLTPLLVATTLESWEAIGARFHEAVADKLEATPEIEALAARIVGEQQGLEAARAIHRWVAGNIEYVAVYLRQMSGWVPHSASEVLRNGYGDCKDQYVVLASLLAARGIEAEPVLVAFDRGFEQLPLPTPLQFDHCMAYLPGFDIYSNPIDPYRDLGELDVPLSGKFVVIASREGRTGRTPGGSADSNRFRVEQRVAIGADGQISGTAVLDFAGRPSGRFRRVLALAATTEQAADDLLSAGPIGGTGALQTSDPSDLDVPLHCEGEWTSDVPLAMGPVLHVVTPTGLDLVNPALLVQFISARERRYPTLIAAIEISWRHQLRPPTGYAFVSLPEGRRARNETGHFESRYELAPDGQLVVERVLRIERDLYPAAQYAALREILLAAATDLSAIATAELQL
jgi:transglutaminase-like putative cysteine protease